MDNLPFWLLTVAYSAHIMEEYFLDWKSWTEKISGLSMKWNEFFVANFAVIILGISSSVVGYSCPLFSFSFIGLALVNALFAHIGTSIITKTFSPGLITSIFLFLPISIWAYTEAYKKEFFNISFLIYTIILGFIIMSFPILLQFLKSKLKNI